jgi:hypothetical protein
MSFYFTVFLKDFHLACGFYMIFRMFFGLKITKSSTVLEEYPQCV